MIKKTLPFKYKGPGWSYFSPENKSGNIFVSDNVEQIKKIMCGTRRKIIIIDDFQYMMANEFMRRTSERGFDKFTEIAGHAWEVIKLASELPEDVRVYILSHTDTRDDGSIKCKTIGKLLDDKITIEGFFPIVLRSDVSEEQYKFSTKNSGYDTVKSPVDLFEDNLIDNDLKTIDDKICEYYEINKQEAA